MTDERRYRLVWPGGQSDKVFVLVNASLYLGQEDGVRLGERHKKTKDRKHGWQGKQSERSRRSGMDAERSDGVREAISKEKKTSKERK